MGLYFMNLRKMPHKIEVKGLGFFFLIKKSFLKSLQNYKKDKIIFKIALKSIFFVNDFLFVQFLTKTNNSNALGMKKRKKASHHFYRLNMA